MVNKGRKRELGGKKMTKRTVALVAERFSDRFGDFILKQAIHLLKFKENSRVIVLHDMENTENNK